MAHKCVVLLIIALATSRALAGPLSYFESDSSTQCSSACPVNTKFSFEPDQTYEYKYESDLKTSMGGASEEHSSLHLRSTVQIEVVSRCELVLRLSDVSLQDSKPSKYESRDHVERMAEFKTALEAHTLRFSYQDGQVEGICPDQEDSVWALNIKRGILSSLQNNMESLDTSKRVFETDVAGTCPTDYEAEGKSWSTIKVKKTKDLLGCMDRNGPHTAFEGMPFQVPSDIQSLPIMKSSHECEQEIKAGIITLSTCTETHVFRPFSRQSNGAMTEVTSKLSFYKKSSGVSAQQSSVRSRSNLLFDHTLSSAERSETLRSAKQALADLCTKSENDIRPEVPSIFARFVRECRKLDTDDLSQMYQLSSTRGICPKAEKFFRDAIPLMGTTASVNLIASLISANRVQDIEAEMWLTSISTSIHRPSKDMITALTPLLQRDASSKTFLSISSLINNYCHLNPECDNEREIQEVIQMFEKRLRYNCRIDEASQHDEILMALKALGNTGHAGRSVATIARCAANTELPMELRVTALQAFRRMPCLADRTELFRLFENTELDSELRIHAYLVLMACSDDMTLARVLRLLESEPINQVGSFIWTHLTNLQETSNPLKQEIRAILENAELKKTFDMDKRKFSRNIELSLFSELLNMGGSVESNILFSENSYIPRSAMVNLTIDVFGQSVNLFELGGRVQGLEQMLEKFFGPGGDMNSREKRAVIRDEAINMLDRQFNAQRDGPAMSYFFRMFGNEIRYGDLHNFDLSNIKDKLNYLEWLIELANEHEFEVTKSIMFLDVSHVIPTVAGMPLRLEADGSASVNVAVQGKMDIRRMFTSPSTFDIHGAVKPSAAVEVTSQMGVDAHIARTGLKMVTTLHTSTVAQGKFQLEEGKIFNMDIDVPQDKMEIISAESKFYVVWRENDREQSMLSTGKRGGGSRCVGGSYITVTGLELCGELSYPWDDSKEDVPFFPFTGPVTSKLYLNKKDSYTGFHFEAKYVQEKTRAPTGVQIKDIAKVQFNTPGSKIDRELTAEFSLDRAAKNLVINLVSPWKKASINADMQVTDALRRVSARAIVDQAKEYSFIAQMTTEDRSTVVNYVPTVEIIIPGKNKITLQGTVSLRQNRKYDVDMVLKNLFETPVSLRGSVDKLNNRRRMKYGGELELSSSILQGKIEGFLDRNMADGGDSLASRLTTVYSYKQGPQQKIVLSHKIRDKSTDALRSYSMDTAWRTTYFPRYDGEVSLDFSLGDNAVSTTLEAGLDDVRKIIFSETLTYQFGLNTQVAGNARFQFPLKHIDYEVKIDHKHNALELNSEGWVKYAENKEATVSLDLKKESSRPLKMSGVGKLSYPGREMIWSHSLEEKNLKEYHHNLDIQLQKYENIRLDSVYKMTPIHDLSATLTIFNQQPMSLNARVNPSLADLMAHIDTTIKGKTYMAEGSITHRGDLSEFTTKTSFTIGCPIRKIQATGEVKRHNRILSANVETSWAPESKVTVSGQMTMAKKSPALELKVTWPQNFAQFAFDGTFQHKGWYETEDDLQGNLHFTSSLPGFEDLRASLKHDITTIDMKTTAAVSWAQNKKIDLDFTRKQLRGNSNVKYTAQVGTPYYGFRKMTGEMTYNLNGNTLESSTKAQWENKMMSLDMNGEINLSASRLLRGSVTFTSPFAGFETISASGRYTDNGKVFNANLMTSWAQNQKIEAQFAMSHMRSGYAIKNNGEVSIHTPFYTFRQMKTIWNHDNTDSRINSHIEVDQDGRKGVFDLESMVKKMGGKFGFDLKSTLQTPIPRLEDIRLNAAVDGENGIMMYKHSADLTFQWARGQMINYEGEIDFARDQLNSKVKFTAPFTGIVTLDMNNRFQPGRLEMANELKYGANKKISLQSSGSLRGTDVKFTATFSTPCPYLEKIILNLENKLENGIYMSHKDLEYSPGKVISIDSRLGIDAEKLFSLSLKTPFQYVRDLDFITKFDGEPTKFTSDTTLNHNMLASPMSLVIKANTADLKNIETMFIFSSPFEVVRSVQGSFSYFRNNGGRMQNKLSLRTPQYQGSINSDVRIRGWNMHNSQIDIDYMNGQKITFSHEFTTTPKIEGKAMLTTPFANAKSMSLNFNHDGTFNGFRSQGVVEYNGYSINGDAQFNLEGTDMTAAAKVETAYNLIGIQASHKGDYRRFTNNVAINFNGKQLTGSSEFNLRDMQPTGKLVIATPYDIIRAVNFNFEHQGKNWRNFENTAALEYNNQRYSANSEFKWYGKLLRAKAKINVPQEYSIKINHRGEVTDFSNSVSLEMAKKTFEGASSFKLDGSILDASASVKTNYQGYENFEVTMKHEGPANNFKTSAFVNTPYKGYERMGAEIFHNLRGNNLQTTLTLTTPCPYAPTFTLTLNHAGVATDFTTSASAEYGTKKIEGVVSFNMNNKIEGSARLTTPYANMDKFAISFSHDGVATDFRTSARVETPFHGFETIHTEYNHNGNLRSFNCNYKLETTNPNCRSINMVISHSMPSMTTLESRLTIDTSIPSFRNLALEVNHSGDYKTMRSTGSLDTPFTGRYSYSIDHDASNTRNIRSTVTVTTPKGDFGYGFTFEGFPMKFKSGLTVTSPYPGYNRYEITVDHAARNLQNIKSSAQLTTPYGNFGYRIQHDGPLRNFDTSMELTTPFSGYERYTLVIDHKARSLDSIRSTATLTTPMGLFSYNLNHNGDYKNMKSSLEVNTPFRGYNKYSANIDHSASDLTNIQSSSQLITPHGEFSYSLTHSGQPQNFRSSLTVTTPFTGYNRYSLNVEHNCADHTDISSSARLTSAMGNYAYEFTFKGIPTNFNTKLSISTPFSGFDKYSLAIQHESTGFTKIESSSQLVTPHGEFSYSLIHNGDLRNMNSNLLIQTPFASFPRFSANMAHRSPSWQNINSNARIETPIGPFSYNIEHQGHLKQAKSKAEVTTPFSGYDRFAVDVNHNSLSLKNIASNVQLSTPMGNFAYDLSHNGSPNNFRSSLEVKTPFQGFETMSANVNHAANDMSDIKSSSTINTPWGPFSYRLTHNGIPTSFKSGLTLTTPFRGYESMSANVDHAALDLTNIITSSRMATPWGEVSFSLNHDGTPQNFKTSATLRIPVNSYESWGINIEHAARDATNIKSNTQLTTPWGVFNYDLAHNGIPTAFRSSLSLGTPFRGFEQVSGNVEFTAPSLRDIKSTSSITTPWGVFSYDLSHNGHPTAFRSSLTVSTPFRGYDRMSGNVELNAPSLRDIKSTSSITTPWGVFSYDLSHDGHPTAFRTSLALVTPFHGYEKMSGNVELTAPSMTDIRSTSSINTPWGVFSYDLEHNGAPKNFRTTLGLNTPFSGFDKYTLRVDHNSMRYNDISTSAHLEAPNGVYSAAMTYNGYPQNFRSSLNLATPYASFRSFELNMEHAAADFSKIVSSAIAKTPFGEFKYNVNHEGSLRAARSTVSVNTPFPGYESFALNSDFDITNPQRTQGSLELLSSMGNMGVRLNHRGTWKNIRSELEVTTPISRYSRFAVNVEHAATDFSDIKSNVQISTPIGIYGFDLKHDGSPLRFTNVLQFFSPHANYENTKLTTELKADDLSNMAFSHATETAVGKYGITLSYAGQPRNFRTEVELTSPHTPYNRFTGVIAFALSNTVAASTEVTSSIPGFERFTAGINHEGNRQNFKTSGHASSSVPGYDRFAASVEHSGGIEKPKTTVSIQTPFRGYNSYLASAEKTGTLAALQANAQLETPHGTYGASYSHRGRPSNFQAEGTISTPLRGYEKFGFEINHNGDARRVATSAQITTPFQNYENFGFRLSHLLNQQNLRTSLNVNTAIPGFEQWSTELSHEGGLNNFNTDFKLATPINGYRNFGVNMNHGGSLSEFQSRGTITLPFRTMPSVTVSASHRGNLADFKTTGSVEYNGKTIQGEASYQQTPTNYEGSFKMSSPYSYLNNLQITGSHTRNGDQKTGRLDIIHNGAQKMDFDYSYSTSAAKNIRIDVRKPYPMATQVNLLGQQNDATLNWDTTRTDSNIRIDLNLKSEPTEKEFSFKATLPRRTVGFTTNYAKNAETITHSTEVMWDNTPQTKASYNMEMTTASRRGQNLYDGRVSVNTPVWDFTSTFNHKYTPGRQYTTEMSIQEMAVKSVLDLNNPSFKHTISAQHPKLPSNLMLTTEGSRTEKVVDGKVELTYDRHVFTYTGRIADESSYSEKLYTAHTQLTHQASNLEFTWQGQYKDNSEAKTANMEATYLTSYDQERKTASLRAEINKIRKSLNMEIITPVKAISLTASETSHDESRGIHNFEIVATMDEDSIRGDFNVNNEEKLVEMKVYQNEGDYTHMYAQMKTATHAKAEVYRMVNGQRHQEAMASVGLSEDQLISTRFFLCPKLRNELSSGIETLKETATYQRMSRQITNAFENEMNRKSRQLARSVEPFTPLYRTIAREWDSVSTQVQTAFNKMYAENQFYLQTSHMAIKKHSASLVAKLQANYAIWEHKHAEMMKNFYDKYEESIKAFNSVAARVGTYIMESRPLWEKYVKAIKEATLNMIEKVRNSSTLRWVWDKINTIEITDLFKPAESYYERLLKKFEPQINKFKVMWNKFEARPEYKYIRDYTIRTYKKSVWAVRYMELDQRLKELIREVSEISLATYRSQLIGKIREYLQLERDAWTVWNPQEGEIGFDLYWPFHWSDFEHLPRLKQINVQKYIDMAKDMIEMYRPHPEWSIYDIYYKYKPSTDVFNWIPPFKTHATIMGSQHFMTFDRRFFEFAGECSYLLARDFIDGTFSVVVNYEKEKGRPVKKSLTVMSNNKQIEVFPDGQVIVDGTRVEMPVTFANTTILRLGSLIRVDNTLGLTVDCNLEYDRCTVNVSGWYYGKTGGMFGTYNNEANDDFTTAEKTRVARPEQLADSWTAGRRCRPENYATQVTPESTTNNYRLCAKLFEESYSLLRPCFKIVDPKPFMTMCLNDMPINENRIMTERDTCGPAAFYVDECRREGVNVRVPGPCVRCEIESLNTQMTEGMNQTLSGDSVPQSADVVFVIQHASCNAEAVNKLNDVVNDLEQAFKLEGIKNNRYSVVGYGGEGHMSTGHTHTMNGQIFNSGDKILLALENFHMKSGESGDGLEAIYFASKLPFRTGVSKTIILLPCDSCAGSGYADVQQVLLQKNIHLHVLLQHNFKLTIDKEDPVSAYIFGADKDRVFTRKDAGGQDIAGDSELRKQLQMPKDLCIALTTDTDGAVFNTLQWTESRPYMQKRFVDVMVRVFADKGHPEDCQECDCVADENGVGKAVCKSCVSPRSFYSFLPGFGSSSSEESAEFKYEETEDASRPNRQQLRALRRKNLRQRRLREQQA